MAKSKFPLLSEVDTATVPTEQAAHYLNRSVQTLRTWACKPGKGPVEPRRIGRRLAWPVAAIRKLVEGV